MESDHLHEHPEGTRLNKQDILAATIIAHSLGLEDDEYTVEVTSERGGPEMIIRPDADLPAAS